MISGGRGSCILGTLGVSLVILGGCGGKAAEPSGASPRPARDAKTTDARAAKVPVTDVKLDLLKGDPAEVAPPGRNPFRFVPKAAPPPPPQAVAPIAPPPPPVSVAPPVPTGPPPPPPIPLKFIGVLEAARPGKVALLADGRGNVSYGKEGDIIEGRYQVLKIGAESVDLAYVDGRGRQTIRLSGQ